MKLLPVVIFIAVLVFSFRLVQFTEGVFELQATAFAEEKAPSEGAYTDDEGEKEPDAVDGEEAPEEDLVPETISLGEELETDGTQWRDAGEVDIGYSPIRRELEEGLLERRKQLERREKELTTREALLRAAEQEFERKQQELEALRRKIEGLLEDQSEAEKQRIESLVKVYEGMKPKDAARIFDTLDIDILVNVMSKMSERKLSSVMASMNPERARTVTIMMAEQNKLPELSGNN